MKTKICSKCNDEKPLKSFYKKSPTQHQAYCKDCFNEYCIKRWIQKKINAILYLGSKCKHCDNSYPEKPYVIFDFHHINPDQKDFNWDQLKLHPEKIIFKELDKCILLCSNCHRIEHYNQHLYSRRDSNPHSTA